MRNTKNNPVHDSMVELATIARTAPPKIAGKLMKACMIMAATTDSLRAVAQYMQQHDLGTEYSAIIKEQEQAYRDAMNIPSGDNVVVGDFSSKRRDH